MLRCPYGLSDAGRQWYLRLKKELVEFGMIVCSYDQALFTWFFNGKLAGVMACQVDDLIFGGQQEFHDNVIDKIRSTFTIGLEEETNMKYLGLRIVQNLAGIQVQTSEYAKSLQPLQLPQSPQESFAPEQVSVLKQFCGQTNWLCSQGRPDIAFESCYLSNSIKSDDVKVFNMTNKIVRRVHNQNLVLNFPNQLELSSSSPGLIAVFTFLLQCQPQLLLQYKL